MVRRGPIRAVVLDWGGTMTPHLHDELEDLWRAAARHLDPTREDELTARLLEVEAAVWARTLSTMRSARLMDLLREATDELDLDVAEAVLTAAHDAHLDAWTPSIRHHPFTAEVLAALRARGLAIGLLSNTHWPRSFHEQFLERDGLSGAIDARVFTSEIDWIKPHPEAFGEVCRALRAEPHECVMVGDRPIDDIEGGRRVGMRTVWVRNDYAPGDPSSADAVVGDLRELPDLVAAWQDGAG